MSQRTLYTIGHSTRPWADFLALLQTWHIAELIDVRTLARSRTFPWFNEAAMAAALPAAGITYTRLQLLGGLRRPHKDSPNQGWHNARFQAYADFMQTPEFQQGLAELNLLRQKRRVCIMCSEAVWWRCHRRMISDAEVARHIPVRHIMSLTKATPHELTPFAHVEKHGRHPPSVTYPAAPPTAAACCA